MIFTPTIQKAIQFAIIAHAGQTRKGKPDVPYITHPLTVGLILARANAVDDVVCAGILHDTVEDSDGNITLDDIEDEFGPAIATLVGHVTEQDKSLLWEQRKTDALAHIYQMPYDALLLKSADVLANLNDLLADLEKEGELVWKRFGTAKDNKIQQQKNLLEAFETIWPENPLLPEIKSGVERICLRK
ncbi:MAG: HD domain-containing protein [Candidatus Andersenbacteria bacterium]